MTKKTESPETKTLIAEYEALVEAHEGEIAAEAKLAMEHLDKAVDLCEKYGISYRFGISPLSQPYIPTSFGSSKFKEIQEELQDLELIAYDEYGDGGWRHSAVC